MMTTRAIIIFLLCVEWMAGVRRESSSTRSRREVPRDSAQEPIRLFCCSAKNWRNVSDKTLSIDCVVSKITFSFLVCLCGKKNPNNVDRFRWGSSSCSHASWRITRWSGWPQSCVDLVWSSIFYFWKFHLILIVVTNLSKVVLTCCNAGSAGWSTIFTYTFYLKLVSMRAALIPDLPGWRTIFTFTCYFKARVNESNALLGWMIYYFVFWLLPMQVDI